MDQPYDTTDFVYPACLPDTASNKYESIRVNVSGWGSLDGDVQVYMIQRELLTFECMYINFRELKIFKCCVKDASR